MRIPSLFRALWFNPRCNYTQLRSSGDFKRLIYYTVQNESIRMKFKTARNMTDMLMDNIMKEIIAGEVCLVFGPSTSKLCIHNKKIY